MQVRNWTLLLTATVWFTMTVPSSGAAETYTSIMERRPDLFHEETGYRISRQRAPTPEDIPGGAKVIDAKQARDFIENGAIALDVFGALKSRYDELDGKWLVREARMTLPGAIWLPETGRGALTPEIQSYLEENLSKATGGNKAQAIIVFCVADCWMSWNAGQRITALGYRNVFWFRNGTDGWSDHGFRLEPAWPVSINVD